MKNDELEVIDAYNEKEKTKEFIPVKKRESARSSAYRETKSREQLEEKMVEKKPATPRKVRKFKTGLFMQTVFCAFSFLFIIGCCFFYGNRLIKYYRIYNPKDASGKVLSLLSNKITSSSSFVYEGDGLYLVNGNYIYKGEEKNNYISFSGFTWRILKINEDRTVDLVLDNSINNLKWNSKITNYSNSDINDYLKKEFLPLLDKSKLVKTGVCNDLINDLSEVNCTKIDSSNYVRLLTIEEFLNSQAEEKSYISSENDNIWLSSRGKEKAWVINGKSLSYADVTDSYDIKPVITLKNSVAVTGGEGTIESPYTVDDKASKLTYGNHIKLDKDIWTVYKIEKNKIYLSLTNLYKSTYRFDTTGNKYNISSKNSIGTYLNTKYLNSLSYKNKLLDNEWYIGQYNNSYADIKSEKVTCKVGLTSVMDFKFDKADNYFLINGAQDGNIYIYKEGLTTAKGTINRGVKPSIVIKKTDIKSGSGSLDDPYVLED